MNSNMVKPEKFGHLYLVYHFTIPLTGYLCEKTCCYKNSILEKLIIIKQSNSEQVNFINRTIAK